MAEPQIVGFLRARNDLLEHIDRVRVKFADREQVIAAQRQRHDEEVQRYTQQLQAARQAFQNSRAQLQTEALFVQNLLNNPPP